MPILTASGTHNHVLKTNEKKMKYSFKIIKYKKLPDNKLPHTPSKGWTSISDIETGMASVEYYEKIESEYIKIILKTHRYLRINSLKVKELDNFGKIKGYKNNQRIETQDLPNITRLILREKMWCKLRARNGEFHFGYDDYLYILCNQDIENFLNNLSSTLSIEKFISPYLKHKQTMRIKPF